MAEVESNGTDSLSDRADEMKYFVFSSYINAYSIRRGLKQLGLDLHVAAEESTLLRKSHEWPASGDTLFFTDEKSLKKFYGQEYEFFPKEIPYYLIDDKLEFARFLVSLGEMPVPFASVDNNEFAFPLILKAKHSWLGDRKLPRGFICQSDKDKADALSKLAYLKIDEKYFFCQKFLPEHNGNNISVSGFFDCADMRRNLMIVTAKVSGYPRKISTGVVVATIPDPRELRMRTVTILSKLSYSGPFEMEFFYERQSNTYYILELNPRFWMQHGLFIDAYDNGLLKRYLKIDAPADWQASNSIKKLLWIDMIALFISLLHFRMDILVQIVRHFLKGYRPYTFPTTLSAALYIPKMLARKLKKAPPC